MPKHFIFDKLSDKKNRLKIALQVSKLGFSPIVMPSGTIYLYVFVLSLGGGRDAGKYYCNSRIRRNSEQHVHLLHGNESIGTFSEADEDPERVKRFSTKQAFSHLCLGVLRESIQVGLEQRK